MAHTHGVGPVTNSGATASISVTLNGTTSGRQLAVLAWAYDDTASTPTLSNVTCTSESNLSILGPFRVTIGGFKYIGYICYLSNITTSGNKTIQANWSTVMGALGIAAQEYVSGDTSGWLSTTLQSASGSSTGPATVNISAPTSNEMILGFVMTNTGEPTEGSGYSAFAIPNILWYEHAQDKLDAGSPGTKTFNMTLGGNGDWGILCASFKLAGASSGAPNDAETTGRGIGRGVARGAR